MMWLCQGATGHISRRSSRRRRSRGGERLAERSGGRDPRPSRAWFRWPIRPSEGHGHAPRVRRRRRVYERTVLRDGFHRRGLPRLHRGTKRARRPRRHRGRDVDTRCGSMTRVSSRTGLSFSCSDVGRRSYLPRSCRIRADRRIGASRPSSLWLRRSSPLSQGGERCVNHHHLRGGDSTGDSSFASPMERPWRPSSTEGTRSASRLRSVVRWGVPFARAGRTASSGPWISMS